jgi:hypothetical protein
MRIGAKIVLDTGLDAAHDGLASLADSSWMMSLPGRAACDPEHPAGRARRRIPGAHGGPGLVAVTFGALPTVPGSFRGLPVHWESVELADALAILLAGEITLTQGMCGGHSTLAMTGFCRLLPATGGSTDEARLTLLKEVAKSFITSVAVDVVTSADPGHQLVPMGPASAWVNGQRSAA